MGKMAITLEIAATERGSEADGTPYPASSFQDAEPTWTAILPNSRDGIDGPASILAVWPAPTTSDRSSPRAVGSKDQAGNVVVDNPTAACNPIPL